MIIGIICSNKRACAWACTDTHIPEYLMAQLYGGYELLYLMIVVYHALFEVI